MPFEYKGRDLHDSPVKPDRCKASVAEGGRSTRRYQCSRKPWKDGWCKQHHPDTEAARRKQSEEEYHRKFERSPSRQLQKAYEEIARLKARIAELESAQDSYQKEVGDDTDM